MESHEHPFWQQTLSFLKDQLRATDEGLSTEEAIQRFNELGPNELAKTHKAHLVSQLLRQFTNPIIILLLVTSLIALLLQQTGNFFLIASMVLLSVGLNFVQEYMASQAAQKLQERLQLVSTVRRDGQEVTLPSRLLVPGDVVLLKAGDMVPADGCLLAANHLFVDQAVLTGESFPTEKQLLGTSLPLTGLMNLDQAKHALFMGSSVLSGSATLLVCRTGAQAYLGAISEGLRHEQPPSSFEVETRKFGYLLFRMTIILVLSVLVMNLFFNRAWLETFLFALALAVGATPEFLPMVMSVTLAQGARRMAQKSVIVKRLSAIHDLGSMDVLCTDKTGTLTEAKIQLAHHLDGEGTENEDVLKLAYLNSFFETGLKNPLDEAILSHTQLSIDGWRKLAEIPFDFERRRVSVLVANDTQHQWIVKGAPEDILKLCSQWQQKAAVKSLTQEDASSLLNRYQEASKKGFRVLGIAYQPVSPDHPNPPLPEKNLIFAGFALFYDPPKAEASAAIELLKAERIEMMILTGDNENVALHLCQQLNIPVQGMLLGKEIDGLTEQQLRDRVASVNLYCRVTPHQKQRIIQTLKDLGRIVGFMGDGINDAPSLQTAHVGISVNTAVDVAKEAADMILLQPDLRVVHTAVLEGRKIFANITKYLLMMVSSNFGNMFSMAGAFVFLPFLPMLPTQIIFNNLLYDLSQTPIPFDQVDRSSLIRPQHWDLKFLLKFMFVMGPLSSIFDLLLFFIMYKILAVSPELFQTGWFMESIATQILIIFVIRTRHSFLKSRASPLLTGVCLALVSIGIGLPYTPLGPYLGFTPPPLYFFLILTSIVVIYLLLAEHLKKKLYPPAHR